jgi:hypothetical protein
MPASPEASELQEQSSIYLRERNAQMKAKRLVAEMELACKRNQLIEKSLVERQLAWLLVSMRQIAAPSCAKDREPVREPRGACTRSGPLRLASDS